jgi:hypothetical protein
MIRKISAGVIAIILIVAACSKKNNDKPFAADSPEALSNKGGGGGGGGEVLCKDPGNSENPLDSMGIYHNLALDYVEQQSLGQPKSIALYVGYSNQYMSNTFGSRVADLNTKLPSTSSIETLLADSSSFYFNKIDQSVYGLNVRNRLKTVINSLTDTAGYASMDYCTIKDLIVQHESNVIRDPSLTLEEKQQILSNTSVARYSLYHWYNKYNSKLDGGETISGKKRKWWQWLVIGIADVAGAVVGATAGSPTGVGAVAGGIAGASGASSGAAAIVD